MHNHPSLKLSFSIPGLCHLAVDSSNSSSFPCMATCQGGWGLGKSKPQFLSV